jgi:HEAT repeat protein
MDLDVHRHKNFSWFRTSRCRLKEVAVIANTRTIRNSPEAELILQALSGDGTAAEIVTGRLASPYPLIRQKMIETLHDHPDHRVWMHLLNCLALRTWIANQTLSICSDMASAQRLDISIVEAFVEDWSEAENARKRALLASALDSGESNLRNAAAYLSGVRGDAAALPVLTEILDKGDRRWQLRSIQAISSIQNPMSATVLLQILIKDHEIYHQEAQQGLSSLGLLAENAWQDALDNPDPHIRWHAARGLAELGNYDAIKVIAQGLDDENASVRWVSSDLLAQAGIVAVPSILEVLNLAPLSEECRQSAYHALLSIKAYRARECLKPLVASLSSPATKHIAQVIAGRLLNDWDRLERYISGELQALDRIE